MGDEGAVIVRVISDKSVIREDPDTLVTVMRIGEAGGVGAPLLAQFNNGLVYGFIEGDMLNPDVIPHTDHIQRYVHRKLITHYPLLSLFISIL